MNDKIKCTCIVDNRLNKSMNACNVFNQLLYVKRNIESVILVVAITEK